MKLELNDITLWRNSPYQQTRYLTSPSRRPRSTTSKKTDSLNDYERYDPRRHESVISIALDQPCSFSYKVVHCSVVVGNIIRVQTGLQLILNSSASLKILLPFGQVPHPYSSHFHSAQQIKSQEGPARQWHFCLLASPQ